MTIDIVTVACRSDNYAFLVHAQGRTALIDAPEASPILTELDRRGWTLDEVWITHHHADHVDGLPGLKERFPDLHVSGAKADTARLPALNRALEDGDSFMFQGHSVHVMDVSGHTVGHIALHLPDARAAFTADSLMALGCGRIFEGTPEMMYASLQKLAALPEDTMIYSGHEYTMNNASFALTIEPDNTDLQSRAEDVRQMRADDRFTVPSSLAAEKATNPFLRAHLASVKDSLSMSDAEDITVFTEIRSRKDAF